MRAGDMVTEESLVSPALLSAGFLWRRRLLLVVALRLRGLGLNQASNYW